MKKKILIYLSLLFCIIMTMQSTDNIKESTAETYRNNIQLSHTENFSLESAIGAISSTESSCRVPRPTNLINSVRNHSQAKRNVQTWISHGFTMTKAGKSMNSYSTAQYALSIIKFPSGLIQNSNRFISLEKLVI